MADNKNYYDILGVSKTASQDEIKAAYRKLVKQYHPDLHPNDPDCAAKFKDINEANEVLSDPDKRSKYDFQLDNPYAAGSGFSGSGFSGTGFEGFGDIFNMFSGFGGMNERPGRQGRTHTYEMQLSFLDAALGCSREFTYTRKDKCPDCRGTGAKGGTAMHTCPKCGGAGKVKQSVGAGFFRTITLSACPQCRGMGKIIDESCPTCKGKGTTQVNTKVKFDIPAGADNGSYIRRPGYGDVPDNGGEPGDLLIYFTVGTHKLFKRKDYNLYVNVPIPFKTACLGGKVMIPALDKPFEYTIPEAFQSGKQIVIKGKGIKSRSKTGDLYVTFSVETPVRLSKSQRDAIAALCDGLETKQNPLMNSYKDNMSKDYGINPYEKI